MPTRLRLGFLSLLLPLGGCALYAPTVPSTPLLSKGQVQVTAGFRNLTALEGGAAWAPTNHLLLSAEGAYQGSETTTTTNNQTTSSRDYHRRLSLGAGYYRAPTATSRWYLAALGGVGWARTDLHAIDFTIASPWLPLPLPYLSGYYEASYRRYYAQVYVAQPAGELLHTGFSLRSTWADYTTLTLDGQSFKPTSRLFIEPTFFLKVGNGPLQGQATLGLSMPWSRDNNNPLSKRTSPVSSLVGVSLIFRPDLLRARE